MLTLITGGSGSGKSEYAENLAISYHNPEQFYIATMFPFDKEAFEKIERHKEMRKEKHFKTIECFTGLKDTTLKEGSTVLLDCLSNLLANEMYQEQGSKENCVNEILEGIKHLHRLCKDIIIVTNEVFSDGVLYQEETRTYMKNLGLLNQELAKLSDEVIEIVYTIPIYHKTRKRGGSTNVMERI